MGWGEPLAPREHSRGGVVIEVAAADHLAAVEADRARLRAAVADALAQLDRHPPMHLEQCAPCRVRRTLTDALEADRG